MKSGSSPVADPEPAAGAASVALPVGRVAALPGQQRGRGGGQREVVDLAERQAAGRRVQRHGVAPRCAGRSAGRRRRWRAPRPRRSSRWCGCAGRPSRCAGSRAAGPAVDLGGVDLGNAAVPPARPGDRGAVGREPRVARLAAVGGQPPGAAAVGRGEPDVVFGDEGQQITVNVGVTEITGGCHAVHLMGAYRGGRYGRCCSSQPAALLGDAAGLGAVAGTGLLDAGGEVVADGALGQEEAAGDLGDRRRRRLAAASTSLSRGVSGLAPSASAAAARSGSMTRWPSRTSRMVRASLSAGESFTINPDTPRFHGAPQVAGAAERGEDDDLRLRARLPAARRRR